MKSNASEVEFVGVAGRWMPAAVRVFMRDGKLGWLSLPKQNGQALKQGVYVKGQNCVCVRSTGGRCNDFLQNQKMGLMTGTRAGALELKSQISNFPRSLVRGSSQQRCGFKPSSTRSGSGPLNKMLSSAFFTSWVLCFNTLLPCISWPFFAGRFRGGATMMHCALSAVSDDKFSSDHDYLERRDWLVEPGQRPWT